jgi:hypothetical protein
VGGYYERLGDILRDTLDSDDDPFETWNPHAGKIRQAANFRERTPPPKKQEHSEYYTVPTELIPEFAELGLVPGTAPEKCKEQWKILLKKYHPDLSGSAENERVSYTEKTTRVTDAYRKIIRWYSTGKID